MSEFLQANRWVVDVVLMVAGFSEGCGVIRAADGETGRRCPGPTDSICEWREGPERRDCREAC